MVLGNLGDLFDFDDILTSTEAKYNLIESLLPRAIREGLSANQSRQVFRSVGFTFSDSRFNDLYRSVAGSENRQIAIRRLHKDNLVRASNLDLTTSDIDADFRFVVDFDAAPELRDLNIKGSFALDIDYDDLGLEPGENELATREFIEESARQAIASAYDIDLKDIDNVRLRYGYRNATTF